MRVPNISKYNQVAYQLNAISSELVAANQEEATGKRINEASDDPSGICMVMDINSSLCCMDQTLDNLLQGQTVLLQAETTLNASADAILDTQLLCSQMAGASANPQDRADAAENLDATIDMMLGFANTQVNGVYIFGGTANDCPPFAYDDPDNPTAVVYQGNGDPMCVKTGASTTMELDCLGCDVFYEDEIVVDGTNNEIVFREDPGTGDADIRIIDTQIPYGTYTREELAAAVEDAMTEASAESGWGLEYEISHDTATDTFSVAQDNAYSNPMDVTLMVEPVETVRLSSFETNGFEASPGDITVNDPDALTLMTQSPEGSEPLTLTFSGEDGWEVENDPGYGIGPDIESTGQILELDMDGDGTPDITMDLGESPDPGDSVCFDIVPGSENNNIGPDMGFDQNTAVAEPARSQTPVSGPVTVTPGDNDTIDFVETPKEGSPSSLTATIEPGTYDTEAEYARAVEKALEKESAENGSRVNYSVAWDEASQTYVITEDTSTGELLTSFDLLFGTGANAGSDAAADLGFYALDVHSGPVSGAPADWGIFNTLFNLQDALAANDVDGIQRAMTRLDNHYTSITGSIAGVGIQSLSLTGTETALVDGQFSLEAHRSEIEDADSVASIMRLQAAETTYQAALSSTSAILGLSLVDYM